MRKGASNMKTLSSLLLVSLSIGVAAPAAARPPVVALPGVSDVLLNLNVAAPAPAGPRILDAASWLLNADRAVTLRAASLWPCSDFNLVRLFAAHGWFDDPTGVTDGDEVDTDQTAPGVIVYHKSDLEVGDGCDTLYITIASVGELTADAVTQTDGAMSLGCFVDDSPCIPPHAGDAGPDVGFVPLFADVMGWGPPVGESDFGATIPVNYTWCLPITPGTHDVRLNLASGDVGIDVSLSKVWVYVDASFSDGQCGPEDFNVSQGLTDTPTGATILAPPAAAKPPVVAPKPPVVAPKPAVTLPKLP
jgi:hypothetical protein